MSETLSYRRVVTDEIMDSPLIDEADHLEALDGLRRLNRASGAVKLMADPIIAMARRNGLAKISLLDVACGGGDVPIGVARAARRAGVQIDLTLLDRSPTAVKQATDAAAAAGISARGVAADVLGKLPSLDLNVDVISNSLFLHHLTGEDEVVGLLANLRRTARRMVVVSDLRRSLVGYAVACGMCRLLSQSEIVRHDGPASVRAAWSRRELADFAAKAGMEKAQVHHCRPWRMRLVWNA